MAAGRTVYRLYIILTLIIIITAGAIFFISHYKTNGGFINELLVSLSAAFIGITASIAFISVSGRTMRKYISLSEKQLNQQKLMADISRKFLADTDANMLIKDTLRMVGEFMNINQVIFLKLDDDGVTLTCCNEWLNPKFNTATRIGKKIIMKEPMLSIIKNMESDSGVTSCVSSNDPMFKEMTEPYRENYTCFITAPVIVDGKMTGVIDFSRKDSFIEWSSSDISLATLFSNTLSSVFRREAMESRMSIVDNSPHIIFYVDVEGNLAYANPATAAATGYTAEEIMNGGFNLLFDEDTVRKIKEEYVPATILFGIERKEAILRCKNGSERILHVTSFNMKDGIVAGIAVDLTEIRALENELIKEKEKAEQASRAKGEFLSKMSHEMRTPMNAIIGMTTIARNAEDDTKRTYALNKVEEASKHLLGIINDVLDMSKIEANKFELSDVEFDLRNLLQKTCSFVRFMMERKQQIFKMKIDDDVPAFLTGDDQRLAQVIINLLSNAVKFTPEKGEISLSVSLSDQPGEEGGYCRLRFETADNGIGVPPEKQDKIFNMFEQAETGTTRKHGGTGLGLSISKYIVELMGGEIHVESEPGKGSRFIFYVNMQAPKKTICVPGETCEQYRKIEENELAGKRALLAEDLEINREILVSLFEGTGLEIVSAGNGKEALDKFTAAPDSYDLIFMDVQMPDMDGLEATRRIRKFEEEHKNFIINESSADSSKMRVKILGMHKEVPVIAMTANVFKEDIENCLNAGMNDHIGKPIDTETLFEKARKYLL